MSKTPSHNPRRTTSGSPAARTLLALMCAGVALTADSAFATSDTWDGSTDGVWATNTNWLADGTVPGTGEIATFSGTGNGNTTIDLGTGVTIGTVLFDTASAAAYTIGAGAVGSQTLTLNDTGAVTMNATVANNQLVNANITLGTAVTGTTTFTNSTTAVSGITLTIAGNIAGGTGGTAGIKTLNTAGTGAVNITGTIDKGGATTINVASTGAGQTTTLSGATIGTFGTLRSTGSGGNITINNAAANITVTSSSTYGTNTLGSKFILTAGTVAFNGGIQSATSSGALAGGDGMGFIVNGGTFSASSVGLGRSYNFSTTGGASVTTAQSMGTSGFQVNGGTATVTGAVNLAGSNSAANGQVSGTGSLTIGGELVIGGSASSASNTTRTTLFQVTGGTLINTDTTGNGIVIAKGLATTAASGELLLTGGTTTTEKIAFGASGALAGSFGYVTLNGASANLYIGSGGIVKNATNAMTTTINLMNGTLGAKADWSSSMDMSLSGSGMTIKAADASNVAKNISLSGVIGGANGFTKTGGGTLTLSGANTYAGTTIVNAGTLALGASGVIADASALTLAGGTLAQGAGFTETLGALNLTASSFITLGDTSSKLIFADSSTAWTSGTLSISGSFVDGSSIQFLGAGVGSNLANILINGQTASIDGSGFLSVSAVPEPATYAALAGLGILGFAAYRRRRA